MTDQTGYNATLDPRTGRPVLPLDAETTRKAEDESQPLTDEDNQGIDIGSEEEEELSAVGDRESQSSVPDEAAEDDESAPSSVEINRSAPRMRAAETDREDETSDVEGDESQIDELIDQPIREEEAVEGERPEALAKFAEVARNNDGRPVRNGIQATTETAPIPMDPTLKQHAATRVLREGVLNTDQGAEEAIDKLPDRTDIPGRRPQGQ
jgi:hypothetical protein